jgi:hypothetical protein
MLENKDELQLLKDRVLELTEENNTFRADIQLTVNHISRLLTDMGLLTSDFEFQFSMRTISRAVMPIIANPEKTKQKFGYLSALSGIIEKYGKHLNENI